jgi:hypothetical protein
MSGETKNLIYDANAVSRILGIPSECDIACPQPEEGELIVYYGGWTLPTLRNSLAGRTHMSPKQTWYDKFRWKSEPGYYRVLLPIPQSSPLDLRQLLRSLNERAAGWRSTPVCIAATVVLVHLAETAENLLSYGSCHCAEPIRDYEHVLLNIRKQQLRVSNHRGNETILFTACRSA